MRLKDYILNSFRGFPETDEEGNIILSRFYKEDEVYADWLNTSGTVVNGSISLGTTTTNTAITVGNWTIDTSQVGTSGTYTPTVDYNTNNIYFHTGNLTTDNDTEI